MDERIMQYLTERDRANMRPYGAAVLYEAASRFHARNPTAETVLEPNDQRLASCRAECPLKVCENYRTCMGARIYGNEENNLNMFVGMARYLGDKADAEKYTGLLEKWKSIGS